MDKLKEQSSRIYSILEELDMPISVKINKKKALRK
jgi:hypothetical protein